MPRSPLPFRHANPHLKQLESGPLPPVKYQILTCQGKDILVGRMKILTPTSNGHAFILRRFDTGAVSLTTMFRAAFPSATEQEEKRETAWIRDNFDLTGFNGTSKDVNIVRLAGIWVSPKIALELAESYSMQHIIDAIASATPDPNGNYRRSGKATSPKPLPATLPLQILPSAPSNQPNPPKRRKESSPTRAGAPTSTGSMSAGAATGSSSPPRRSSRLKSPTPKPPSTRQRAKTRIEQVVVADTIETIAEDSDAMDVASQDLHDQDMTEQKALIADLKAEREAAAKAAGDDESKLKRTREEDEQMIFDFKEPAREGGDRVIATNRKVSRFQMEPRTKAAAWGVVAFAFGLGAVSFLPNFM